MGPGARARPHEDSRDLFAAPADGQRLARVGDLRNRGKYVDTKATIVAPDNLVDVRIHHDITGLRIDHDMSAWAIKLPPP